MTAPDLAELRRLAENATPGPWHAWDRGIGYELHVGAECSDRCCNDLNDEFRETFRKGDAAYIAAVNPATVLALLDRLESTEYRLLEVRRLHYEAGPSGEGVCHECMERWPCATAHALGRPDSKETR